MKFYDYLNALLLQPDILKIAQSKLEIQKTNPFIGTVFGQNTPSVKIGDNSIFTGANKEELEKIDYNKLTSATDNDTNTKFNPLEFVLKTFLSIDAVKKLVDKDNNGEISAKEARDYIKELIGKDGNIENLSPEDFEIILEENNIYLEVSPQNVQDYTSSYNTGGGYFDPSVDLSAPSYYSIPSGNYSNYNDASSAIENVASTSITELESEKTNRQKILKEKQKALQNVYNGENVNIKAAKENLNKAKEEYEKAIQEDAGAKKFAQQILDNNKKTDKNEANLDKNTKAIDEKNKKVADLETALETLKDALSALTDTLAALPKPTGKEEDKKKDAQINTQKAKVEKLISDKKCKIEQQKQKIEIAKKELEALNTEKTKLEAEKQALREEKEELDRLVKEHCTEVTKTKLEAFNKAKENYETVKVKELENAKTEVKTAENSLKEIEKQISEKKSLETANEYISSGNGASELKPGLFKGKLAGQEALVTRLCKKYGIDPALVASIIGLESGWGTSNLAVNSNNFMGYRSSGDLGKNAKGFGKFSTPEKGLDAAIKNLSKYTRFSDVKSVDFNNLNQIGRHYCDNTWAQSVQRMHNSRVKKYIA